MARQQLPDGFWVDVDPATGIVPIDPDTGEPTGAPLSGFEVAQHLAGGAIGAIGNALPRSAPPAAPVSPHPLPGVGGGAITPPGNPLTPAAPSSSAAAAAAPTPGGAASTPIDSTLQAWSQDHGGVVGAPAPVKIKINPQTGAYTDQKEKAHPWTAYMFADGSRLTINDLGETESELGWTVDKRAANKALSGFLSQYGQQTGVPAIDTELSPNGAADPNPYYKYVFTNPSGGVTTVSMNASGQIGTPPKTTAGPAAVEGATRSNVQNGYQVQEVYKGGQWVVDPSVPPKPYTPETANKPVEGNTRPNVQNGYQVQEIYKGGQWVVDPSVPPKPYTPETAAKPVEGNTRPNVQNGYQIQEIYRGGQWVVDPSVPPKPYTPETAAKPVEGNTRPNVQGGYQVQEVYRGGQWVIDPSVPPKRYTPERPTQLTPSTTAPVEQYMDDQGNITERNNPNFQPKTFADVQARRGQLATIMQAKSAEVQGKVGTTINGKIYTSDDALRDYNTWHAQQIEPQIPQLLAAQQAAEFQQAKDQAAMRTSAYTAANAAGTNAINAFNANRQANPVGPGFAAAMNQVAGTVPGMPKNVGDVITYRAPNPMELAQSQTQDILKYIDPSAAAAAGLPPPTYQNMSPQELQNALGANRYAPRSVGAPAAPAGGGGAAVAPAQAQAATTDPNAWFTALMQRQAQDVADQRIQAQVPPPAAPAAPAPAAPDNNASRQWAAAGIRNMDPGFTQGAPAVVTNMDPGFTQGAPAVMPNQDPGFTAMPDWLSGVAPPPPPPPPDQQPPGWNGVPQTLMQQYGTANPWDIYAPNYTYG